MKAKTVLLLLVSTLVLTVAESDETAYDKAERYIQETLNPYIADAASFQRYVHSHPDEFEVKEIDEDNAEFYVKSPSWVKLDKGDFNSAISKLGKKHRYLRGKHLQIDDDKLFLSIEDTNLFDELPT
ncbi:HGL180Cp [Eremothecium sinecaudum]|uniref:HGL180Cp n=1 Tax=Eremothecium sinecaudum TaxID=45286 RepID=A0A0X8HVI2_9SACH|nr:HGL180Cp [Eremothecium sinecaudum]AMD22160.1 HGL180Cp [Eremothecium sinecaudum]